MKQKNHGMIKYCYLLKTVLFLLLLSGCMNWETNTIHNGIEFSKIRYETSDNDTLTIIGYLKKNTIIEGYPCAVDWVHFTKDWRIKFLRLSEKSTINNYSYDQDTWIKFTKEQNVICVFPKDTYVQGYLCKGDGSPKGISTSFYKNGRLQSFFSEGDIKIERILCAGGVLNNIELYENGALKECTIATDNEINGVIYKKNTRIQLDETGKVITAT